ncbi:hypothetical protein ACH4E9_11700 [Streptomyces anulatus]|uniref:hypothetical protein n=1 Tax=Streptomyces anulatus TaxID=1892 RepID=UPI00224E661E|nr:hypothetical protein [Streptomyces anulatus]MCX4501601.1 hypothetical protein [Streptomyces anulatus]
MEIGPFATFDARGTNTNIRLAIGQLIDYTRFLIDPNHAILLPHRPQKDLIKLAHRQQVALIWPSEDHPWESSAMWLSALGFHFQRI